MDGHLVAVEVGVEALADERMQLDRVSFHEHRLERLNAHAVQCRSAIEQHGVIADHLFEDIPDFVVLRSSIFLARLDRIGVAELLEPANDERLEQFQRDLLRQAALMQARVAARRRSRYGRSNRRACRASSRGSDLACP